MTVIGVILPGVDPLTTILTVHPPGRAVRTLDRARDVLRAALARRPAGRSAGDRVLSPYPKIELHVHLEATIAPETLLEIAKRNGETLPADTVEGLRELYRFRDFDHFIEVWILTTNCLRTRGGLPAGGRRLRRGGEAARRRLPRGDLLARSSAPGAASAGTRSSAATATAPRRRRRLHGVEVRLTPDITRSAPLEDVAHPGRGRRALPRPRASSPSGSAARRPTTRTRSSSRRSEPPARPASARSRTPARSSARNRFAPRSTCSSRTASATASARSRTRRSSRSSPTAGSSST